MAEKAIMPFEDYKAACDAIREKTGGSALIKSGEMAGLIEGIESGGAALPTLTNEGAAADLVSGKQLIDQEGNIVEGINPYELNATNAEVEEQADLIAQIQTVLEGKASVSYPVLSNPATAENLEEGYELIDGEGNVVVGSHVCSGGSGGGATFSVVNNLPDLVIIYGKDCLPNETTTVSIPIVNEYSFGTTFGIMLSEEKDYYNDYYIHVSYLAEDEFGNWYDEIASAVIFPQNDTIPFMCAAWTELTPYENDVWTISCGN
jgi:hypothetical protein